MAGDWERSIVRRVDHNGSAIPKNTAGDKQVSRMSCYLADFTVVELDTLACKRLTSLEIS